jgi:hypothetical protein
LVNFHPNIFLQYLFSNASFIPIILNLPLNQFDFQVKNQYHFQIGSCFLNNNFCLFDKFHTFRMIYFQSDYLMLWSNFTHIPSYYSFSFIYHWMCHPMLRLFQYFVIINTNHSTKRFSFQFHFHLHTLICYKLLW